MNTILLKPTDVLFFRDGRPMEGSLAGHGAAWPMPNIINHAFHAALHRAGLENVHGHNHRNIQRNHTIPDGRKFGSLVTAGPFPVMQEKHWFFPRPLDIQNATLRPALLPTASANRDSSSLTPPLEYAVANRLLPSKDEKAKAWLSEKAYERYLTGSDHSIGQDDALNDSDLFDAEQSVGIAIDPATQTTGQGEMAGKIYSAHSLRLRENAQLGVCAQAQDKDYHHPQYGSDLIPAFLNGGQQQIIVGGQQRICTALCVKTTVLPLPCGKTEGFNMLNGTWLVKWVLLSPAIWPSIAADPKRNILPHSGGWLPNWIHPENGNVLLRMRTGITRRDYSQARHKRTSEGTMEINARLVAAIIPKPIIVTGWALSNKFDPEAGGAKSTHLAVPAGAVYYFEAESEDAARSLASVLNWHGNETNPSTIKNRRSTLLGEKGYGLGVCGTWKFFEK